MSLCLIKGDRRSAAYKDWGKWLECSANLHDRFLKEQNLSPFDANEQSAVGLFAAGAAIAGHLPLIEYGIEKKDWTDKRRKSSGRADLWIDFSVRSYSFEFKRAWYRATTRNLHERLARVRRDIACVGSDEHDGAAACLIAYVEDSKRTQTFENFAKDQTVDLAYRIGPADVGGAYLFFSHEV